MIVTIRISGKVGTSKDIEATLERMNMKRKFSCSLLHETLENKGMINKVKQFIAYGKISKETLIKLLEKRGKLIGNKKINKSQAEKITAEILDGKLQKKLRGIGIKPFFRLHPPVKGLKNSKADYPRGDLGNHGDKINLLLERML